MKKYTYNDWLNNKIDYRIPGGQNIVEADNGLHILLIENRLSKDDYKKISEAQEKAYDRAVERTVECHSRVFEDRYKKANNKKEFLNCEIQDCESKINENLIIKKQVLLGNKQYSTIRGDQYLKIMNDNSGYSFYGYSDNMRITAYYRYLQWLQNYTGQDEVKTFLPLPDCFKDKGYLYRSILNDPRVTECYEKLNEGAYRWTKSKRKLGGLAQRLLDRGKLIDDIKSNQDLARIFCPFFNLKYDSKEEKSFQPEEVKKYRDYYSYIQ